MQYKVSLEVVDYKGKELADLEMETKPEDVLAEIHRLQTIERIKKMPLSKKNQTRRNIKK